MGGRLLGRLRRGQFAIVVALPQNTVELARAAAAAGADALKVHVNVTHRASRVRFGTLAEERRALEGILSAVDVPVGIVPGAEEVRRDEVEAVATMGFDFLDMFAHFAPPWYFDLPGPSKMVAVDSTWTAEEIGHLDRLPGVDMVELSIVPLDGYGQPLTLRDLARYGMALQALASGTPAVVPTQRAIEPDDIARLAALGVAGAVIGVIYTGSDPERLHDRTRAAVEAAHSVRRER